MQIVLGFRQRVVAKKGTARHWMKREDNSKVYSILLMLMVYVSGRGNEGGRKEKKKESQCLFVRLA